MSTATVIDERTLLFSYAKIAQDTIRDDLATRPDLELSTLVAAGQMAQLLAYENDIAGLYPARKVPDVDLSEVSDYLLAATCDALFDGADLTHAALNAVLARTREAIRDVA